MKRLSIFITLVLSIVIGFGQTTIRPAIKASIFDNLTGTSNSSYIQIGEHIFSRHNSNSLWLNKAFFAPDSITSSVITIGGNSLSHSLYPYFGGTALSGDFYPLGTVTLIDGLYGTTADFTSIAAALRSDSLKTTGSVFNSPPLTGKTNQKQVNEAIDNYITNYRMSYQGLAWNDSTDTYQRLGSLMGLPTGSSPGNGNLPIQSKMRGCVLNVNGTVNYYLADYDWRYKEDGTASILTGADGNVMVQIPAFYYKYASVGRWHTVYISLYPLSGYSIHPAFMKDGIQVAYRYIGAYEAVLYSNGTTYVDYWSGSTQPNTSTDKLASVSGFRPVTNFTRAGGRAMAARIGTGWRQQDADIIHVVQLLMLIEYGTFYIQNIAEVGPGITNIGDWAGHNNYYPFAPTGNGNTIGNSSGDNAGLTTVITDSMHYSRYRGIENFYGHLWKWIDGININSNVPYVTNNSSVWADNTSTGYTDLGVTLANSNGWQKTLVKSGRVMLPASVGGSSSTYITDYYYQDSGWRVALFGGSASNGAAAGAWCWNLAAGSGGYDRSIGGRLAF